MRIPFGQCGFYTALFAALMSGAAQAQMSNRPFNFSSPGTAGLGISIAGQQAILNQHITGATPDVLLRDANGMLLDVVRGPERIAVVTGADGDVRPGFRRSFRTGSSGLRAGAFNSFFVADARRRYSPALYLFTAESNVPVDTWTTRVVTDGRIQYSAIGPVNTWTGYVYGMDLR